MAKDNGFSYVDNRKAFDNLDIGSGVKLPVLGLFASLDIPYEIDRLHAPELHPSQAEMTRLALKALSAATKDSDKGFFVLIEGSRIDHTGHANDPAAHVHEVLAHNEAFEAVLDFLEHDENEGVLVGTSDHETGGLAAGVQLTEEYPHYHWFPEVLAKASHSAEYLQHKWHEWLREEGSGADLLTQRQYIRDTLIADGLGISDVTDEEIDAIIYATPLTPPVYLFASLISRKAMVGWTTHGHTGKSIPSNIFISTSTRDKQS